MHPHATQTPSPNTPAAASPPEGPPLPGVLLSEVTPVPVQWLWPGRLASGKITILDGDPGVGKSTLYASLAATLTASGSWPAGKTCPRPGAVVIVTGEDDPGDTIQPRLAAAGADLGRVRVIESVPSPDGKPRAVSFPNDTEDIGKVLSAMGAVLLVIDPLSAHLDKNVDSHNDASIRSALTLCKRSHGGSGSRSSPSVT